MVSSCILQYGRARKTFVHAYPSINLPIYGVRYRKASVGPHVARAPVVYGGPGEYNAVDVPSVPSASFVVANKRQFTTYQVLHKVIMQR